MILNSIRCGCADSLRNKACYWGSSGTVLCGVQRYASAIPPGACVVAISPDMGDRYVDTLYNPDWVNEHFPEMQGYEKCAIAI